MNGMARLQTARVLQIIKWDKEKLQKIATHATHVTHAKEHKISYKEPAVNRKTITIEDF